MSTHTILILHWAGDKKKNTYHEWTTPLEVEDHEICPGHHRPIIDGLCPDCDHEQEVVTAYRERLLATYGRLDFADLPLPPLLVHPIPGHYQKMSAQELKERAEEGRKRAAKACY